MSTTTDARPIDLAAIEARRKAAWLDGDDKASRELIANDVPDMLLHLREAQQPADSMVEYTQVARFKVVQDMAAQGWRLHSAVPFGSEILYILVRGDDTDRLREQRDAEQRRADRLAEQLAALRAGQIPSAPVGDHAGRARIAGDYP